MQTRVTSYLSIVNHFLLERIIRFLIVCGNLFSLFTTSHNKQLYCSILVLDTTKIY